MTNCPQCGTQHGAVSKLLARITALEADNKRLREAICSCLNDPVPQSHDSRKKLYAALEGQA